MFIVDNYDYFSNVHYNNFTFFQFLCKSNQLQLHFMNIVTLPLSEHLVHITGSHTVFYHV